MAKNTYGNSFIAFYVDKILGKAWDRFKDNWVTLLLTLLTTVAVSFGAWLVYFTLVVILGSGGGRAGAGIALLTLLFLFIACALCVILTAGWVKVILKVVDKNKAEVADLFSQVNKFFPFLAVLILYSIVVMAGLMLFVIPGIIWGLMFMWAPLLVIDKGLGPIEALKKSKSLTDGAKWDLFLYKNLEFGVVYIASLTIVGLILAMPFTMLAKFELYRHTQK